MEFVDQGDGWWTGLTVEDEKGKTTMTLFATSRHGRMYIGKASIKSLIPSSLELGEDAYLAKLQEAFDPTNTGGKVEFPPHASDKEITLGWTFDIGGYSFRGGELKLTRATQSAMTRFYSLWIQQQQTMRTELAEMKKKFESLNSAYVEVCDNFERAGVDAQHAHNSLLAQFLVILNNRMHDPNVARPQSPTSSVGSDSEATQHEAIDDSQLSDDQDKLMMSPAISTQAPGSSPGVTRKGTGELTRLSSTGSQDNRTESQLAADLLDTAMLPAVKKRVRVRRARHDQPPVPAVPVSSTPASAEVARAIPTAAGSGVKRERDRGDDDTPRVKRERVSDSQGSDDGARSVRRGARVQSQSQASSTGSMYDHIT